MDWSRVKRLKALVIYSNLLLVPWFFIGLLINSDVKFLTIWVLSAAVILKIVIYFKVKTLQCPRCGSSFVQGGMSLAFQKKCSKCSASIDS